VNIRRSWLWLALLFSAALVIGFAIPTSLAYLTAQSNTLLNTFDAPYFAPDGTEVTVRVHKTVLNTRPQTLSPEGFTFTLLCNETGETIPLTADANGNAYTVLVFDASDVDKTYTYQLSEVNDGREYVTYSENVYNIRIALTADSENKLTADIAMNGETVESLLAAFENIYAPPAVPHTGDGCHPMLYLLLAAFSGAGMLLLRKKRHHQVME